MRNLERLSFMTVILSCILFLAGAQERYVVPVFDSVTVETYTYEVKNGEQLGLDVYSPAWDAETSRPVILYIHGGGFSGGVRNDHGIVEFCKRFAAHGYVAVSMSYRLTRKDKPSAFGCDCPAEEKLITFQSAMEDIHDATFFLIRHFGRLGIDPHRIILAGSSAGAEAALIAGYTPPNCFDLDSGPVSYAGIISMAGAIPYLDKVYEESAIPTLFFHGTCDNLVPYATAPHHYCNEEKPGHIILYGSHTLSKRLEELNVPYWLHTTCGGGHELAGKPMRDYFDEIMEFCHEYVIQKSGKARHTIVEGDQKACDYQQFEFCSK